MRGRNAVRYRPAALAGVLLLVALGGAAWLSPAAAQDATPEPMASPAGGPADCAPPLGLPPGSACVTVVHAVPNAPDVDVSVDGAAVIEGLAFGTSSGWIGVPAGEHRVQVAPAGASPDEAIIDASFPLEAGAAYEVAVVGQGEAITAAILLTNLDPLPEDRARIRVFQAIPDAPPAEVGPAGGDSLLGEITFGSATGYAEVPANETPIDLEVRALGAPVVFPIAGVTLEPELVYTFYAIGQASDPASLGVLPVVAPAADSPLAGTPPAAPPAIPLPVGTPGAGPQATPSA